MAAPMREGAPAGGPRPAPAHHLPPHPANFEYDDNEWDIGIGDLIIDLDADIEKTDGGGGGGMAARAEPDAQRTALKMKIKRTKPGTKSSEAKHEIVKSNEMNGEPKASAPRDPTPSQQAAPAPPQPATAAPAPPAAPHPAAPAHAAAKRGSGSHRRDKTRDKHPHGGGGAPASATQGAQLPHGVHPPHDVNGSGATRAAPTAPNAPGPPAPASPAPPPPKQPDTAPACKPAAPAPPPVAKPEPSKPSSASSAAAAAAPAPAVPPSPAPPAAPAAAKSEPEEPRRDASPAPPPAKRHKSEPKETAEVCVGTSVGTITEPDCLGPCEPGTSVTLEGIVWHETEGVLVVNVTWRGKTYVGTLLDCTRHDWAPPRFCDSPTEELDARTPKGRGKRGRGAIAPDLANFTETRSSVHSKLRNGGGKGRRAQPSPTPFTPPPRADPSAGKRRLPPPPKQDDESSPSTPKAKRAPPPPSSPPPDPVLLECPEPNCSKKYKHANGLKYHRSHAHGSPDDDDKDGSGSDTEGPATAPASPTQPSTPAPSVRSPDKPVKSPDKQEPTPAASPAPASAPPTPPVDKPSVTTALKPTALRFSVDDFPPVSPFQASTSDAPSPHSAPVPVGLPYPAVMNAAPLPGVEPVSPTTPQPPGSALGPSAAETSPRGPPTAPSPQFKVKSTASLMPEESKAAGSPDESPGGTRRARSRPSPDRAFPRDGVRSPAYSDISDDAAPNEEGAGGEAGDKPEPPPHVPPAYPVYQYYGQPPYLVSATAAEVKAKEDAKVLEQKRSDKEGGKGGPGGLEGPPPPQKMLPQHFYPYGYIPPGFAYNVEPTYAPHAVAPPPTSQPLPLDDKNKDGAGKSSPAPGDLNKPPPIMPKHKSLEPQKDPSKHPNENHQILKESIEMKSQMNPYVYQQRQPHPREEEVRRYYMLEQRRKELGSGGPIELGKPGIGPPPGGPPRPPPSGPIKPTSKEPGKDEKIIVKEEPKIKQEGQKPTMETTGPPPPPTSQYYLPPYMQGPHYGALPFDPVYRGGINPMLVSGPYGGGWGGVAGLPRYHAPEDLSRPPPAPKPLDLMPSYYPPHKIHELSDHAKSPPNKTGGAPPGNAAPPPSAPPPGKPPPPQDASPKESSRSPPPQRHVHTHHHTHVGLGYPLYPAPYGAAVLASQQAVVSSFPTTK